MSEMPADVAATMYEAVEAMNMQSPEHRGPHAPNNRDLKAAKEWLFEHTEIQ